MTKNEKIPFLDLVTPHQGMKAELLDVFDNVLATGGFIGGPIVNGFEKEFAKFCDTDHCVGVSSGTDALRFALMAIGIKRGSTVITVPNTFIATTEAITQAGGVPAFVDIDGRTYNLDPAKLREYLEQDCCRDEASGEVIHRRSGAPVSAIVPVHLYGQPADMDAILDLADRYHLPVVEDACQAHGADYYSERTQGWRRAGSMGRAAAFSFYPGKNLGACGEGGAVTTNDPELAAKIRMLRDHGQSRKYFHDVEGYNGRLDAVQAGILRVKLKHLGDWNGQRRQAAAIYRELFVEAEAADLAPYEPDVVKSVYHLYVIRVQNRDELIQDLAQANIGTGIHYPMVLHKQNAYQSLENRSGGLAVAEKAAGEIVSLPMFPQLTKEQQVRVVNATVEAIGRSTEAVA